MNLYCNSTGCTLHDYPVTPMWCQYLWHQKQADRRQERLLTVLTDRFDSLAEDLRGISRDNPDRPRFEAPSPPQRQPRSGGGIVQT